MYSPLLSKKPHSINKENLNKENKRKKGEYKTLQNKLRMEVHHHRFYHDVLD